MAVNRRPSNGGFSAALTVGGTVVFRSTPNPSGTTASLPSAGAAPVTHVWQEVYADGATTASYILAVPAGRVLPSVLLGTQEGKYVNA